MLTITGGNTVFYDTYNYNIVVFNKVTTVLPMITVMPMIVVINPNLIVTRITLLFRNTSNLFFETTFC